MKQLISQNKSLRVRLSLLWLLKALFRLKYFTTWFKLRIFHYWGIFRETNEITELFITGITSDKIHLYSEVKMLEDGKLVSAKRSSQKWKLFSESSWWNREIGTCQVLGAKILALSSLDEIQSVKVNRNSRRNTLINWRESLEKWQTIKGLAKILQNLILYFERFKELHL